MAVFRTPGERLARRVLRTSSDAVYNVSIRNGAGGESSKAEPEGEEGDEGKEALVPLVDGSRHRSRQIKRQTHPTTDEVGVGALSLEPEERRGSDLQ